jgi:hypothetical protein
MAKYKRCLRCNQDLKVKSSLLRVSSVPGNSGAHYKLHQGDFCGWQCIVDWLAWSFGVHARVTDHP